MTCVNGINPGFGCNSHNAKFGNARINAELTARIQQLRQEIDDCSKVAKEDENKLSGIQGADNLLQGGLLAGGALAAIFGAQTIAAGLVAYPLFKGLLNVIQTFKK